MHAFFETVQSLAIIMLAIAYLNNSKAIIVNSGAIEDLAVGLKHAADTLTSLVIRGK